MQRRKLPIFILVAGILLAAAVAVWIVQVNAPEPLQKAKQVSGDQNDAVPFPEIERVSVEEAHAAFDTKQAVFLDVRDSDAYESKHIAGAVLIPLADLEARISELDQSQRIITYCT
jgi:hypothetical protein